MIGNIFISALIAIFFLGRTTKDKQEKTRNASWFRTIVYGILTIIAGFLFYKSYQVATIVNIVDLEALRGARYDSQHSKDTVECLSIYNKFRCLNSYKNDYLEVGNKYSEDGDSMIAEDGGAIVDIHIAEMSPDLIENSPLLSKEYEEEIFDNIGKKTSELGPIYLFALITTNIPSFIPLYPKVDIEKGWERDDENNMFKKELIRNTRKDKIKYTNTSEFTQEEIDEQNALNRVLDNGILVRVDGILDTLLFDNYAYIGAAHQFANTMDILTAADISQYTYVLRFASDMYVKQLVVDYNIPIEVSHSQKDMEVGTYGFSISDEMIGGLNDDASLAVHVKLPTMANLQQIRSLVLTALLTTFFSLFFTNFFYRIRKHAIKYRNRHKLQYSELKEINRKRITQFKYIHYTIAILLLLFVLSGLCILVFGDKTFLVNFVYIEIKCIGVCVGVLVIILVFVCLFYINTIPAFKRKLLEKIKEWCGKIKEWCSKIKEWCGKIKEWVSKWKIRRR